MNNKTQNIVVLSAIPKSTGFTAEMLKVIERSAPDNVNISKVNFFDEQILQSKFF